MKLIGDRSITNDVTGDGQQGRTVLVGVKLDPRSRELLTWALVKVAESGDLVIALHVLDTITEGTASLLSLVKTFDSVLAVYEGFCNLKQVDLKLKVCRGASVQKLLVQQAKSCGATTVIVGTSKTHHAIRSTASVAKYCARKLPKYFSVLAVDNSKVAFHREAAEISADKVKLNEGSILSRKSFSAYSKKNLRNCESCAQLTALQENSAIELTLVLSDDHEKEKSLALVPIQKLDDVSKFSIVVQESNQSKPAWSRLHHAFLPKKQTQKSFMRNTSIFQQAIRQPSWHSSALVHPDHKQTNIKQDDDSTLYGDRGAMVPLGSDSIAPPLCRDLIGLPKELLGLLEKYSSSCRFYGFQELVSATANFLPENLVGKGGSSHVYRGRLLDGKEVAVKVLKPSQDSVKEFVQEIEIIGTLHHKNIISLSGFCFDDSNCLLVYDFLSRGSLEENLHVDKDCNAFGWRERYKVALGIAEAVDYLHNGSDQAVIHRDVKSSNILLSDDFEPKLSDFGLASWGSSASHNAITDVAGTFGYIAPEYVMHGKVTDKIDVYAFGVVLLELLSSRKPINNECPKGQESIVMWATPILKSGKLSELLDPCLGSDYDYCQIERMVLAATLCIRRAPRLRPQISLILKLLNGDEEVTSWAKQEISVAEELDRLDGEPVPTNIQSHLCLALLDLEDDIHSISSTEQTVSLENYLQGRWSRSSSFD
ncbi:hypothetical protein L6164_024986 [Bauhinia variegata]|uniref:Uncharacterized protein n=1 Tax=Bauhinia variegata TaxID=167791 RepID=A0ACB9LZ68_BAUVA|nr:hypothetical protein L6164_024986 [Bauhinia variegata]